MRCTKEFKLECVRKRKAGAHIDDPDGCKHTTFMHAVRNWVRTYDALGEIGLEHKKPKRSWQDKPGMHNREIVAFSISRSPNFSQTTDMPRKAFTKRRNLGGLILRGDQGWQYQMEFCREELKKRGIGQSMSRKGDCLDNSPMENFFGVMKNEMFYGHEYGFKLLDELEKR